MRIGFDATALPLNIGGAGNYIIRLIHAFTRLPHRYEFVIFAHQSGYTRIAADETKSFEWVLVKDKPPAQRLIWEQTSLPILAAKTGIDLLHSPHYTRPLKLPCASVVTFHDMTFFLMPQMHTRSKRAFFPKMIRYSSKHADVIITDSESTRRDTLRLLKTSPQKIITIPLGVDPSYKEITDQALLKNIQTKYHLPNKFVLFVGTLEPRKNLPVLLHAFQSVIKSHSNINLVIVGGQGWGYTETIQLIDDLGLKKNVLLTGYVQKQDLPSIYNLASIFVYPSSYEGAGLPPVEAMACGTPVITTNVSSMPEYIGDAGILVPPNDINALTNAMIKLLNNPDLCDELSHKGQIQSGKFTWEQTAKATLQVYDNILLKK